MRSLLAFLILSATAAAQTASPVFRNQGAQFLGPNSLPASAGQTPIWHSDGSFGGWLRPQLQLARDNGWSVISSRPHHPLVTLTANTSYSQRLEIVPLFSVGKVKVGFSGIHKYSSSQYDAPHTNQVLVRCSLEDTNYSLSLTGSSLAQTVMGCKKFSFAGRNQGRINPNEILWSDELQVSLTGGARSYITTFAGGNLAFRGVQCRAISVGDIQALRSVRRCEPSSKHTWTQRDRGSSGVPTARF